MLFESEFPLQVIIKGCLTHIRAGKKTARRCLHQQKQPEEGKRFILLFLLVPVLGISQYLLLSTTGC